MLREKARAGASSVDAARSSTPARDLSASVYLKATWVVSSLRHPALRVLNCLLHLASCFFLCSSSPLLAATQTPGVFPVYGDWVLTLTTGVTWQKVLFHTLLSVSILLLLRLVVYRRLLQRAWNWRGTYRRARRTFSRLSGAENHLDRQEEEETQDMLLRVFTSRVTGRPTLAVHVVNDQTQTQGSWTLMALGYPFCWSLAVYVTRLALSGSEYQDVLVGHGETAASFRQFQMQATVYVVLMMLSTLKLVATLDLLFQDRTYCFTLFSNWCVAVRRAYITIPLVRLAFCWLAVAGIVGGGVGARGFRALQTVWLELSLSEGYGEALEDWFPSESWRAMITALVMVLDALWLIQDWSFPCFASVAGTKVFGWPREKISLGVGRRFRLCFTSKWVGCFLVMGALLPLEGCLFAQTVAYSPAKYGQFDNPKTFRVMPLNQTSYLSDEFDAVTRLMLEYGSVSRYFHWSSWDSVPAFASLLLGTAGFVWLCRHEQCKMKFSAFLGMPAQQEKERELAKINSVIPATTKAMLQTQLRLRALYDLRARSDGFCIILAGVSAVTVVLQFRSIWQSPYQDQASRPLQSPGETYALLLLFVTLTLIHQLRHRYDLKMEILALKHEIPHDCSDALWKSPRRLFLPFLVELVACAFCLPPLIHGHVWLDEPRFSVSNSEPELTVCPANLTMADDNRSCTLLYRYPLEILNMVVLVRLYWFVRVVRNLLLKKIIAAQAFIVGGALQSLPVDSFVWSFRVSFSLAPMQLLMALFIFLWVGTAAALSVFERPFPSTLDDEENSLWVVIETMATVGYGDAFPITGFGRAAMFLGAIAGGTVFVSLLISIFLEFMKGSKREHKAIATIERVKWERQIRQSAALVISSAWKRHSRLNSAESNTPRAKKEEKELLQAAYRFKLRRKDKPKETYESLRRLQMTTISLWCSHDVKEWIDDHRVDTQAALTALEAELDRIEASVRVMSSGN